MKPNDTALRKRTQISSANRMMFIWIAVASALVSFAIVTSIFLGQKLVFNEKVLIEKNKTISTLDKDNKAVPDLESAVRVLDTNPDLAGVKANDTDQTIQVILDALPSDANSLALGASLQNKLLAGVPGLTLQSLQVDPVQGVETLTDASVVDASAVATDTDNQITFNFSVSGNADALRQALTNLERSIRTIDITNLQIQNQGNSQIMTVQARAFYQPVKNVSLYDKVVKP
jgi:cell division protein FtsL